MFVAKVNEITSGSREGIKQANERGIARVSETIDGISSFFWLFSSMLIPILRGIARASMTIDGISSSSLSEEKVVVKDGTVAEYRVTMRVSSEWEG